MIRPILLDTCAAIWISQGDPLHGDAVRALDEADDAPGAVSVSLITAWEIGLLVARGRMALATDPATWFRTLIGAGVAPAPLTADILVASSFLPGGLLRDPADRMIAATARATNARLMTRDERLLEFAAAGHVAAIRC